MGFLQETDMKGFQLSFLTEQNQSIDHKQAMEWLLHLAKELGISGCTVFSGVESFGADGRRHSARFFELGDQPVEVVMAATPEQADRLFARIGAADTKIFYIKTPIEYGQLGRLA
jgi:PII-like signaling protein